MGADPVGSLADVRTSYDTVAGEYARRLTDELGGKPTDRALLSSFAETVTRTTHLPVADVGCGPGHITTYLAGVLGVPAFGVDLSAGMLAEARQSYPHLCFVQASMTSLPISDQALGGIIAFYSIIHVPTDLLPGVFGEFRRVLAPGGNLVLAFQSGDGRHRVSDDWGHQVALDFHRRTPDLVADLLATAGFEVRMRMLREPEGGETSTRAYVWVRRPDGPQL